MMLFCLYSCCKYVGRVDEYLTRSCYTKKTETFSVKHIANRPGCIKLALLYTYKGYEVVLVDLYSLIVAKVNLDGHSVAIEEDCTVSIYPLKKACSSKDR